MRLPAELPPPRDPEELVAVLGKLGATVLREVTQPGVMAVFRLAVTEAQRAPEVAATLEIARASIRAVLRGIVVHAQAVGLLAAGDPDEQVARYLALLWGDLMVSILLRLREAPAAREIDLRAGKAAGDFLRLYRKSGS